MEISGIWFMDVEIVIVNRWELFYLNDKIYCFGLWFIVKLIWVKFNINIWE